MKKFIALAVLSVFTVFGANAQYRGVRPGGGYRPVMPSSRYRDPGHYWDGGGSFGRPYFGLRLGAAFSNICGDSYVGGDVKTGVNVGMAVGFPLSGYMPLYLESGLTYTEKGEKNAGQRYNLDYLDLPFVFKYKCYMNDNFALEPYFGGYVGLGVAGKTRAVDGNSSSYSSFGDQGAFRRGDAGIKFGCGISFNMLYADITYDWGLANISHNSDAKTGAFMANIGVNF